MNKAEARALTDQIKSNLTVAYDLIVVAWKQRVWEPLEYESWNAYCIVEFGGERMVRLTMNQRQEIVASLSNEGMSTRAIGSSLGIDESTARHDLKRAEKAQNPQTRTREGNPAGVRVGTGLDGKVYHQFPTTKEEAEVCRPATIRPEVVETPISWYTNQFAEYLSEIQQQHKLAPHEVVALDKLAVALEEFVHTLSSNRNSY